MNTPLGEVAAFTAGLERVGEGVHAWLQPNGGLGESNAGLIVGDGASLLVDTLWDLRLTRAMLDAMAPLVAGAPISTLVNTHGDGDHCWGNQLLADAQIVATRACAQDMREEDPRSVRMLGLAGRALGPLGGLRLPLLNKPAGMTDFMRMLSAYDFSGIELTFPTKTFTGRIELKVGGRAVVLHEVGPAHTPGDLIVHVPDAAVVFAADVLFNDVSPIMWVGPVENWLAALDKIEELAPDVVVPGHGPVGGLAQVGAMRRYWELVAGGTRARVAGGMKPVAAARDLVRSEEFAASEFAAWRNVERIVVNAAIIARSDAGETGRVDPLTRVGLIASMGELARELNH